MTRSQTVGDCGVSGIHTNGWTCFSKHYNNRIALLRMVMAKYSHYFTCFNYIWLFLFFLPSFSVDSFFFRGSCPVLGAPRSSLDSVFTITNMNTSTVTISSCLIRNVCMREHFIMAILTWRGNDRHHSPSRGPPSACGTMTARPISAVWVRSPWELSCGCWRSCRYH